MVFGIDLIPLVIFICAYLVVGFDIILEVLEEIKEKRDLFSDPFFKKVIAILKYICMPTRKISELRKILYFDFFSVSTDELAILRDTNENDTIYLKDIYNKLLEI